MLRYKLLRNEEHEITSLQTSLYGAMLLRSSHLNKGSAFDQREREELKLIGRLAEATETIEQQAARAYDQYLEKNSNLGKNVYLNGLHDVNETLFYYLVSQHLEEMLPIIYTPTVGDAVIKYSLELRMARGLYFAYPQRKQMREVLQNRVSEHIDIVLVTDGEGVLGIGDQGVGGMDISIAKLMVYTLCAGVNPNTYLPMQLDVGTNNEKMLNDPMYLGWRHPRLTGAEYDDFIAEFVQTLQEEIPGVYLHWEDFGRDNARKNLETYRDQITSFNDDMQGTGATALACVLSGVKASGVDLKDHRVAILGAGTAGCGIADQVCTMFEHHGMSPEEAKERFWLVDRNGLLVNDQSDIPDFQKPYLRKRDEVSGWNVKDSSNITLQDVTDNAHPTILIGCSTCHGAFTESIIKSMAAHCPRPIILPLSNPTKLCEAEPKDLIKWTDGTALIATGSPFDPVEYKGKTYVIGQSNNAFVFPGLGLAVIATKATKVSDDMLWKASDTLSDHSPARKDPTASLLPRIDETWALSREIALAVAKQAREEGLLGVAEDTDLEQAIDHIRWKPQYVPYHYVKSIGADE
ncbi:MAG: NAD-dependent malic enzyme [Coxiellaceae bacterium]|nr:NAD-dependent malic enzyme [Coxiellaceae bacterium]